MYLYNCIVFSFSLTMQVLEVIATLTDVLKGVCKKGAVSEAAMMECYPKLVTFVDEMIKRGILGIFFVVVCSV